MVVISESLYEEIRKYIRDFIGLPINCENELKEKYNFIEPTTLSAILSKEWQYLAKYTYSSMMANSKKLLNEYETTHTHTNNPKTLLNIAIRYKYPPIGLSRTILHEKYKTAPKSSISEMLKNPHLIPDQYLANNVSYCLFSDCRDGPIPDIIKQCVGEEYETKLKQFAADCGMVFSDENDLRRTGFDKTPDLKLAIPCLYKGFVFNWIESKASFGDIDSHQKHMREQLDSYTNRFGPGLIIYWFGYVDTIVNNGTYNDKILITDSFPCKEDLQMLNQLL